MSTKLSKAEKNERKSNAIGRLRVLFPSGVTIYSIQTGRSKSGMGADYRFFVVRADEPMDITSLVSDVTGYKWKDSGSLHVGGCGYSRGQHVVETLGMELHDDVKAFRHETF